MSNVVDFDVKTRVKELLKSAKEQKDEQRDMELEVLRQAYDELIDRRGLYHSEQDSSFFAREGWEIVWYPIEGFFRGKLDGPRQKDVFWGMMEEKGRMVRRVVNSLDDNLPHDVFNAIDKSLWLQPASVGEQDPWIEVLMLSLANGDVSKKEYIEHILAYKYIHPDDLKIPTLWFYGEGGAGKNILAENVLPAIFTTNGVITVGSKIFEGFNGQLLGKVVVFLDEVKVDRVDFNRFKKWVGNRTIDINIKYGAAGSYENTILWIAGGNGFDAAPPLSGDSSDRRWSPIRLDRNIMEVIAEYFGVDYDKAQLSGRAVDMFYENEWRFSDKEIIAKWLTYIIKKHGKKGRPLPIVDEDVEDIKRAHTSPHNIFITSVFGNNEEHGLLGDGVITSGALFELYKDWYKVNFPSGKPVGVSTFGRAINDWVRAHRSTVEHRRIKIGQVASPAYSFSFNKHEGESKQDINRATKRAIREGLSLPVSLSSLGD